MVFIKVPKAQNSKAERLAKLASSSEIASGVYVKYLERKMIEEPEEAEIAPI